MVAGELVAVAEGWVPVVVDAPASTSVVDTRGGVAVAEADGEVVVVAEVPDVGDPEGGGAVASGLSTRSCAWLTVVATVGETGSAVSTGSPLSERASVTKTATAAVRAKPTANTLDLTETILA